MSTAVLDNTATAGDLLFGDVPGDSTEALTMSLHEHGNVRTLIPKLPPLTLAAAERELAEATDGLLSLNLADVAAAGWKKYGALRDAALSTRNAPTAQKSVALATHTIDSSYHPTIDLLVDDARVATIKIDLQIDFRMAGVIAVVRDARLTEIRSGTCTVTASLSVQQIVITNKQRQFDLPGAVRLRHGLPLLEPATAVATAPQIVSDTKTPDMPEAWYSDPTRRYELRWWDGSRWTQLVTADGYTLSDPLGHHIDSGG
jgi:Protein of unknown function (DUF2510)